MIKPIKRRNVNLHDPTAVCTRQDRNMGASIVAMFFFAVAATASLLVIHVYGSDASPGNDGLARKRSFNRDHLLGNQGIKAAFPRYSSPRRLQQDSPPPPTPSGLRGPAVYHVTAYGADPTGRNDSTEAILRALSDALNGPRKGFLLQGIDNLGGARVDLDGGNYFISRPIQFPVSGKGNLVIHGGSLTASNDFPNDGYLIDLTPTSNNGSEYNYEFVTLRDLYLDSNYRGGGIQVTNSLRTNIDNCYVTHFNTTGIAVHGGHETYIRHSYLGQHITAGGDPSERAFSGTGIILAGNDNSVTDVVIFSAQTGIIVSGQANLISGVHCYNKATGFGGVGIYLRLPGLTQTRVVNSYMDFTGIVAEDPVQLTISNNFFLGDAFIQFKSIKGVMNGVTVSGNAFAGSDKGIDIVQLDQTNGAFNQVDQVSIDKNSVKGMQLKTTVARASVEGNGTSWTADFAAALIFPNLIKQVQYTFITDAAEFPNHFLRNVSENKVVIQSSAAVPARVYITADQGGSYSS